MTDVQPLPVRGAFLLPGSTHVDERGEFSRIVDTAVLDAVVDDPTISYIASAHNARRGTLRGLHYQAPPHEEAKTIWCQTGSVFDVLVDLRPSEPTFGTWASVDLTASESVALHLPKGVAHGYQTTSDDTTLVYMISAPYAPDSARTINWQDPSLAISWPLEVTAISERDAAAPAWQGVL